jgi:hypothetical protein
MYLHDLQKLSSGANRCLPFFPILVPQISVLMLAALIADRAACLASALA